MSYRSSGNSAVRRQTSSWTTSAPWSPTCRKLKFQVIEGFIGPHSWAKPMPTKYLLKGWVDQIILWFDVYSTVFIFLYGFFTQQCLEIVSWSNSVYFLNITPFYSSVLSLNSIWLLNRWSRFMKCNPLLRKENNHSHLPTIIIPVVGISLLYQYPIIAVY